MGGGHAATMELSCFKRQVGGGQLKRYVRKRCDPGRELWAWMGKEAIFFLPSSLVAKSGLSPMRI